jgi:PAS domain S-box-containing protein
MSTADHGVQGVAELEAENARLRAEMEDLRERLREPEEIIRAIRYGEVDAVVVEEPTGESVYPLRRADTLYRELVEEAIPFGVWMATPAGDMSYLSRSFLDYTGLTIAAAQGSGWMRCLPSDEAQELRERWRGCVESRAPWELEISVCGADDSRRTVLSRGVPVNGRDGQLTCWVGVHVDITARKEAEQALRTDARRKDEFLAILAHELRNPLAPIQMAVDLLSLSEPTAEQLREIRELIGDQVRQMSRLIGDLVDVARVTRGAIELRTARVELERVVRKAVGSSWPLINQSRHELTVTAPGEPLFVEADEGRLLQIIENLLTNAAKYTDEGGLISLTIERDGQHASIRVRDTGIGIPAEMQPHVFDMFVQVDGSLERSRGGLGIGLSLVKQLVELHGGSVHVHSDGPRRGSEFVVRLPVAAAPAASGSEPLPEAVKHVSVRRIVVVDDSKVVAEIFCRMLSALGHTVSCVHNPEQAIDAIRSQRADLVFSDISMPQLNGYELARRIRSQSDLKGLLLVAMTGYGQPEDVERARDAGFDHHLVKPAELSHLRALFASIERSQSSDQNGELQPRGDRSGD